MLHRPLAPNLLTAQAWNTGLKLGWDTHDDPTLSSYVVEEAPTALGPWTPVAMPQAFEMNGARMFVGGLSSHGPHYFRVIATDVLGRAGDPSQTITGTVGAGTRRFSGVDRVRTAAAASAGMFTARAIEPTASDTVVIAPDSDYVQALAANSLAGRYGASVLVAGASLPSATAAEILRLGVHKALIVGTQSAISPAVDAALRQLGLKVDRITASDRYGVAANVAARLSVVDGSRDALVVNGGSRADMCALMPVAYSSGRPVIVVKRTSMPPAFKALIGKVPLDSAMVIGGTSAVSTAVTRQFGGLTEVSRVSGRTSAGTAAKLASWAVRNQLATWDNVSVANPALWAQSLNIGAASHGGVVLLTSAGALSKETASALRSNAKAIGIVDIFGGLGTVSSSVQSKIHTAISIQTGPIMDPPVDSEPPDGGGDSESGG
jgi:hypothetical protein